MEKVESVLVSEPGWGQPQCGHGLCTLTKPSCYTVRTKNQQIHPWLDMLEQHQ